MARRTWGTRKATVLLAMLLGVALSLVCAAVPARAATFAVEDLTLYELNGSTTTLNGTYAGTKRIVIVGRPTCPNTRNAIEQAEEVAGQDDSYRVIVLDCDGDRGAFSEAFAGRQTSRVHFASYGSAYNNWAWRMWRAAGNQSTSVTLPFIVLVNEQNQATSVTTGPQDIRSLLGFVSDTMTVSVQGTQDYDLAYKVLDLVNKERKARGYSTLAMDKDLLEAAMQRAAELSISYSHTRPDGTSCFTASTKANRENIAAGTALLSASDVMELWMNSEGHRNNILADDNKSMGVGMFRQGNAVYWVQLFGRGNALSSGRPSSGERLRQVKTSPILTSELTVSSSGGTSLFVGDSAQLSLRFQNRGWSYGKTTLDSSCVTWSSSNAPVVSADASGKVTARAEGAATITAKLSNGASATQRISATVPRYTVSFNTNGGSSIPSQRIAKGGKVTRPANPTRSGYTFVRWRYVTSAGVVEYNFNDVVTEDLTLVAEWRRNPTPSGGGSSTGGSGTGGTSSAGGGSSTTGGSGAGGGSSTTGGSGSQQGSGSQRPQTQQTQTMYRLYNRYTGEHFYTASASERDSLVRVGWTSEGTGWVAPKSGTRVYRLYNPYVAGGDHHYTMDVNEYNQLAKLGWKQEGVGWYSGGSVPVYRQYNPYAKTGTHNYTTSRNENDELVRLGWRAEGTGWYAVRAK